MWLALPRPSGSPSTMSRPTSRTIVSASASALSKCVGVLPEAVKFAPLFAPTPAAPHIGAGSRPAPDEPIAGHQLERRRPCGNLAGDEAARPRRALSRRDAWRRRVVRRAGGACWRPLVLRQAGAGQAARGGGLARAGRAGRSRGRLVPAGGGHRSDIGT